MFKNKDDKPVEVVHQLKLGNDSVMLAFNQTKTPIFIYSVADLDPGSGAFLTAGSGIRNEHPGSYFRELRNKCFGLKIFNSL